jgi:hypothetical protein
MDMRPIDRNHQTMLHCDSSGGAENDTRYSCIVSALLAFQTSKAEINEIKRLPSLSVNYQYKRLLLPQWEEIDTKMLALIQSFVVSP